MSKANIPIFSKITIILETDRVTTTTTFFYNNNSIKGRRIIEFLFHFIFDSETEMMALTISFLLVFVGLSYGLNNGLGRTPQMGKLKNKIFY
jgi:hypothetical protein